MGLARDPCTRLADDKISYAYHDGQHHARRVYHFTIYKLVAVQNKQKPAYKHELTVNMGANQSRPSDAAINEKLVERLQALQMKDERKISEKDGFVVVGDEARM